MVPSKACQIVHVQSQIGDRRQHGRWSGGEQIPAVRTPSADVGKIKRGKPGDPIGPAFESDALRANTAETGLHLPCFLTWTNPGDNSLGVNLA